MKKSDLYDHIYSGDLYRQMLSGKIKKPLPDYLQSEKRAKEALVVISNLIARAGTKWNKEEQKLFLYSISKIDKLDKDCWLTLKKSDITDRLHIDTKNTGRLREQFESIRKKSDVRFTGPGSDEWEDGSLIRKTKGARYTVKIQFEETYLPLLTQLTKNFTSFYLEHILCLDHRSAINLYMFLTSWADIENYPVHEAVLMKKDIPFVFGLSDKDYWRKDKNGNNTKFDWASFEKTCLKPAIDDINAKDECDLFIGNWEKVKDKNGFFIVGYKFEYCYRFKDGSPKWANIATEKYDEDLEANRLGQADDFPYNLGADDRPLK